MNNWFYNKIKISDLSDFPENCHGFVYKITNRMNSHFYIGRKILRNNIKRKIGKKEKSLIVGKGRKPKTELMIKESNWKTYMGSSQLLLKEIKEYGIKNFDRQIIELGYGKKHLTFLELKHIMKHNALENDFCLNENVMGKFFKKDLVF